MISTRLIYQIPFRIKGMLENNKNFEMYQERAELYTEVVTKLFERDGQSILLLFDHSTKHISDFV